MNQAIAVVSLTLLITGSATGQESGVSGLGTLSLEDLMKVEVTTVSRQESTVGQSPAAVFVITQEMIRRSGATTIPELLRMVPGLNVARLDGNKWAVSARGFNDRFGNKLLVQMDGRTLYNPIFSGVYWDTVDYPLEDIERIEIVRGPGASVWGANAVNGIINIITKSAKDTPGGLISGGGGTEEQGFGVFRYGGRIREGLDYRVYGKGFSRDDQMAMDGAAGDGWWGASVGTRVDWQAGERDNVSVQGQFGDSVAGRKDLRPLAVAPFVFTNVEDEVTYTANVMARWKHTCDDESNWALQMYWDHFDRTTDNEFFRFRFDTFDLDFQHQLSAGGRHKLIYGAGYRVIAAFLGKSTFDNGFFLSADHPHRNPQLLSAFLQDEIALVPDRLAFTVGSKFERNDFTGFECQPTARLLWTPTPRQSVWAAISRAVRTPNLSEDEFHFKFLTAAGTPVFLEAENNRGLNSEEVIAYELGYRAQATPTLSVDVAVFYNVYKGLRAGAPSAPISMPPVTIVPVQFSNGMDGETYGAEVAATWRVTDWWRLQGAYTFLEMQLHRDTGFPASAESIEGQSPEQQVTLQSSWNFPGHVECDLIGRLVDSLSGFNPTGVPGVTDKVSDYVSLDIRVAWKPRKDLEISVVGQNLLDAHHPEFGTNPFVRSPLIEIQRGVYGKITWWF